MEVDGVSSEVITGCGDYGFCAEVHVQFGYMCETGSEVTFQAGENSSSLGGIIVLPPDGSCVLSDVTFTQFINGPFNTFEAKVDYVNGVATWTINRTGCTDVIPPLGEGGTSSSAVGG